MKCQKIPQNKRHKNLYALFRLKKKKEKSNKKLTDLNV